MPTLASHGRASGTCGRKGGFQESVEGVSVIFTLSFSLVLISFYLYTFPCVSCWIFLCNFTGFLAIFKVVTLTIITDAKHFILHQKHFWDLKK